MSKMNDLVLDVAYFLNEGMSFADIARELDIPISYVVEACEIIHQEEFDEECSPYATINS